MNQREDVLKCALQKNEEESQRWQTYLKENEISIANMSIFSKRLTVDVMVPVGKKAFMPGHLLHTNEVLVGHYQGYFSKCTTFKAKEICELRIKKAKQYLEKLETEADMWRNKLHKPHALGVIQSGEEMEIIEEFNEETERVWKEKHRIRVKHAKNKEREEREKQKQDFKGTSTSAEKMNEEIFNMLEEAELMDELEQELDTLKVDEASDETIRKLISGEIKLPQEKRRLAHDKNTTVEKAIGSKTLSTNIVKVNDIKNSTQINTNNNIQPNPQIMNLLNSQKEEVEEETLPDEVELIKEQAKYLYAEDQIGFYDYQIQIIRQKLQLLPLRTQDELNEKIHLLNILEHLEELLEEAEESVGGTELGHKDDDEENRRKGEDHEFTKENSQNSEKKFMEISRRESYNDNNFKQKRRISFALENQTLEFRKNEAVTQMLPLRVEKPQRDIIKLDDNNDEHRDKYKLRAENSINKIDLIQAKVKKNLQFMEENQSKQDFDLVQQILQCSKGDINTLHIKFEHSQQEGYKSKDISNTLLSSPADLYNLYTKSKKSLKNDNEQSTIFINSYEGEEQVHVAVLKETDRETAFVDPKAEFSNPVQAKSILKNKFNDEKENHYEDKQIYSNKIKNSKKKSGKEEDDYPSAYYKVMHDVVEKSLTEPEPLPDVKFIDAHTPKKRISRFKQMRQGNEKT